DPSARRCYSRPMSRKPRVLSDSAAAILGYFVADPEKEAHGFDVIRATGIASGTLYPALRLLSEEKRVLTSRWEARNPVEGLPPRRFYRLDPDRATAADALLAEHRAHAAGVKRSALASPKPRLA